MAYDLLKSIIYFPKVPFDFLYFRFFGINSYPDWRVQGWPVIQRKKGARIEIGRRFTGISKSRSNSWGIIQPVVIKARTKDAIIEIGDDVGISGCTITAIGKISIGNNVIIGSGAVITDNDAHPINPIRGRRRMAEVYRPVKICEDVFIGARAMVLKGVTIGKGSVVGASAVVTRDVPSFAIVAGNPAKIIGDVRDAQDG